MAVTLVDQMGRRLADLSAVTSDVQTAGLMVSKLAASRALRTAGMKDKMLVGSMASTLVVETAALSGLRLAA
jgi:hypothetical protein